MMKLCPLLFAVAATSVGASAQERTPVAPHPPIPVRFSVPQAGFVTLVIEDMNGQRVRNLISETRFSKGAHTVYWDGLDDIGRLVIGPNNNANAPKMVQPGNYRVRGLVRPQINVSYQMSPYTNAHLPWATADKSSEWLTNHTPPQAMLFVPKGQAPTREGQPTSTNGQILVGSNVAEGGSGLAWLDTSGRKVFGQMWIGGIWTGASFLARDVGTKGQSGVYAYTASAWDDELRLYELRRKVGGAPQDARLGSGDDAPVLVPKWKFPGAQGGAWNQPGSNVAVSGLAVRDGLIVAALPKLNGGQLLFVDAVGRRVLGTAPVADPRGLAFDAQGRLLVLSGSGSVGGVVSQNATFASFNATSSAKKDKLLRYLLPPTLVGSRAVDLRAATATASRRQDLAALAFDGRTDTRWETTASQEPGQSFTLDLGAPQTFSALQLDTSNSPQDHPRGYEIHASQDGQNWGAPLATGAGTTGTTTIAFARTTARYLKITQTGTQNGVYWSIDELRAFEMPDGVAASNGQLALSAPQTLVNNLQNPQGLTLDGAGNVYVSQQGESHHVVVLDARGKLLRAIGRAGKPKTGPYDALHMNNPVGLTIDDRNRLWVAENDYQPKRLSVWNAQTGALLQAFYGPAIYGGGGELDARDKTVFYHHGMTLKLDWKTGESKPINVLYRISEDDGFLAKDWAPFPQTAFVVRGRQFMTNSHNVNPTGGAGYSLLWEVKNGVARAVASIGRANDVALFKTDVFKPLWPKTAQFNGDWWENNGGNRVMFVWNDLNGNGQPSPNEVQMRAGEMGGVLVQPDLSFMAARYDEHPTGGAPSPDASAVRFAPTFTATGAPRYAFERCEVLAKGAQWPTASGGDQALLARDGWTILTTGARPFESQSISGAFKGQVKWQYPSVWPGLHASQNAPMPSDAGEMIGTTRLLGDTIKVGGAGASEELWAINGNKGNLYLMTTDGLFVATLFRDSRTASWNMPQAKRGMLLNDYSLNEESFWPTITQTSYKQVYLVANASILRVDGLNGIKRLPPKPLRVTAAQLVQAQTYFKTQEAARQAKESAQAAPLQIILRPQAATPDGKLDEWDAKSFVSIDNRASVALAISGDRLFAAFKTGDDRALQNSGDVLQNLFKSGGALDIQLGAIEGGERLLVSQVKGKTLAVLYRPKVAGTAGDPFKFTSNIGTLKTTITDRVDDVSSQITLAQDGGNFEISVPLSLLSLSPQAGQRIQGDVGVLRGNGFQTLQRVYWRNKASGLVSDLASEAELSPQLWGEMEFIAAP